MRKTGLVFALLLIIAVTGCTNLQRSSQEEAQFVVHGLDDYQECIQYLSVESKGLGLLGGPSVYESNPSLGENVEGKLIVHEIIYKTKNNTFKLVILNDERPPKIIATKEFK